MAFSIKSDEADRLVRELCGATGESLTEAVTKALRERLRRIGGQRRAASLAAELDRIALRCAALPVLDHRSPDEILGWDGRGLPH
jgi:antitoxin VapB